MRLQKFKPLAFALFLALLITLVSCKEPIHLHPGGTYLEDEWTTTIVEPEGFKNRFLDSIGMTWKVIDTDIVRRDIILHKKSRFKEYLSDTLILQMNSTVDKINISVYGEKPSNKWLEFKWEHPDTMYIDHQMYLRR